MTIREIVKETQPDYYRKLVKKHSNKKPEKLTEKENTEIMKQKNFETWKNVYEKFYGIPLEYTCEKNNNK